jgi:hypothetical protein
MRPICYLLVFSTVFSCEFLGQGEIVQLFENNTDTWIIAGDTYWQFEDEQLVGRLDSGAGLVMTKEKFFDFQLTLEFLPDSTINSGVFIRCQDQVLSAETCYEFNIWDLHPNQDYRTGAIVTHSIPLYQVNTINKWNTYEIRAEKGIIRARINGKLVADLKDNTFDRGYVGLQAAGTGEIRFRNVFLRRL